MCVLNSYDVFNVPVGEFGWEEAFQVWRETATLVSGLLCHMWGQSLLEKHPGKPRNKYMSNLLAVHATFTFSDKRYTKTYHKTKN